MRSPWRLISIACLVCVIATPAFGQGTKTSLTGTVVDSDGGVVPGATVVAKNDATSLESNTVTNTNGVFAIPSLDPGTYTVTVTLSGFKQAVYKNVVLVIGSPGNLKVTLQVGGVKEQVEVRANTELIQTSSTAVSSTISAAQINNLPLTSRNTLFGFVIMLPGVDAPTGVSRDATLFGLPEQAINISIDGINTQNNFQRSSDGFYSMVFPQLDAVEQVTVTGAAAGSEAASGGSVGIKFVTRSGGNRYAGTAYYNLRHPAFNSNYYFNDVNGLPKNRIILNQGGGSLGGPIKLPGYDGSGKAFFFFNYEEFYQPTSATRTRTLLHPSTAAGIFRYNVTSGGVTTVQEVNVLALMAANGHVSRIDPVIGPLLAQIRTAAGGTVTDGIGVISDQNNVNQQQLIYQAPGTYYNHLPTTRLDFNLNSTNRLSASYWWQEINRYPDIQNSGEALFPGLPNVANYTSVRSVGSITLRSTLSSSRVNELIGGWQWSPGTFNSGVEAGQFDNQGGFSLGFPLGATAATRSTNPNTRHQANVNITDTMSWLKGAHNFSFGGGFTRVTQANDSTQVVPSLGFGIQSGLDPTDGLFTTANFPGASTANLTDARALYSFLTGRVTSVNGTSRLNEDTLKYEYLGVLNEAGYMDEWNAFIQDSWKFKPTVTLNYGAAWVVQLPMSAGNGVYSTTDYAGFCGPYGIGADGRCKLFQVGGEQTGVTPQFVEYSANTKGYNTDWNNIAPNVGIAWRPNRQDGFLRKLFGDPDQATFRAGFSIGFNKAGFDEFTGVYSSNPGRTFNSNRNNTTGSQFLLVNPGESWPVLFTDRARLGPPAGIPEGPAYPIAATTGSSLAIFDPAIQVPYSQSFSIGFQRAISQDVAVEVRYVGTRGKKLGTDENWNEANFYTNSFFDEFKNAQANLRSHVLAGCGQAGAAACSFAYRGAGTGTVPLPIYLAYISGIPTSQAGEASQYTNAAWTNSTLVGRFSLYNPSVSGSAGDLQTTARIANAGLAGLPSNYFRMNPAVGTNEVSLRTGANESSYDSVVLEVRRRLSRGFLISGNYTWSSREGTTLDTLSRSRVSVRSTGEVPWAFKMTANWEVPVGRGKRYGTDMDPWVNGVIGNWSVAMTGRYQSGRVLTVTGRRLVGMTEEQLQSEYYRRQDPVTGIITLLPDDIILNTRRAHDTSPTSSTGYGSLGPPEGRYIAPESTPECQALIVGDCGARNIFLHGPDAFVRFDFSARKMFPIGRRFSAIFEVQVLNFTNAINFTPVFNPGSGGGIFQVTSAYTDTSGNYDPGGRLGQLVFRLNF